MQIVVPFRSMKEPSSQLLSKFIDNSLGDTKMPLMWKGSRTSTRVSSKPERALLNLHRTHKSFPKSEDKESEMQKVLKSLEVII